MTRMGRREWSRSPIGVLALIFTIACSSQNGPSVPDAAAEAGAGGSTGAAMDAVGDGGIADGGTFGCQGSHADASSNLQCARGLQYCYDGVCYDLASVGCAQQPTCLCVDHGYVNCHCTDDGQGAVTHLGCDMI